MTFSDPRHRALAHLTRKELDAMSAIIEAEAQETLRTILETVHTPEFPDRSLASVIRRAVTYGRPLAVQALMKAGICLTRGGAVMVYDYPALTRALAPAGHEDTPARIKAIRAALIVDGNSVEIPPASWEARQRGAA